jgi:hypothetical protein
MNMTGCVSGFRNFAFTRRSAPGEASSADRRVNFLFLAILAGLAAIFITSLVCVSTARAEDRKTRAITFLSGGLKTAATAQSTAFDVSAYNEGQIFIDVTAEGAVSTLDITIQVSPDNTTWYTHTTLAQITAIGQTRAAVTNFGNYMRINYVLGGTSFTFSVTGVFKN